MPRVDELDLPVLSFDDLLLTGESFHELMNGLRSRHWIATVDGLGYVVLDRDAVEVVLRSRNARMPAVEIIELQGITTGPIHEQLAGNLINLRGEDHRRLRALVQPAFTPQAAADLRPAMRTHLGDLFSALPDDGACEFVADFAAPFPARMIAEIVGAPLDDASRLGEWAYWIQSSFDPTKIAAEPGRIEQAAVEFDVYVRELLRREEGAGETMIARLRRHVDAGDVTEDECVHLISSVLIGGVDTTRAQLSHTIRLLAENPAQWRALRDDPSLVQAAVDEALRFEPIAPFTARLVTSDLTHRDVTFPKDSLLFACALTANHDPGVYSSPDRFDIAADRGDVHPLSFGAGPHFCLGAALARAELEEALAFLAARVSDITLEGVPSFDTPPGVYGMLDLPVRFDRTAEAE